ncbi:MAG TPA: cupin domain-containing protein [Bacteroidota bacterium]|jgi:mannose-6-phosphate isomerase-like protein (cupin superfamily)|nr:cupin domain-containing protein [Bacteroidota bacterium]
MDGDDIAAIKQQLRDEGYNIYVYSYPGGMCFPPHQHDHDTIHVVLSGSIRISYDDTDHILKAGERFLVPAFVLHSAEVIGEMPVVVLDATAPRKK